jgi:hypothetical protein
MNEKQCEKKQQLLKKERQNIPAKNSIVKRSWRKRKRDRWAVGTATSVSGRREAHAKLLTLWLCDRCREEDTHRELLMEMAHT